MRRAKLDYTKHWKVEFGQYMQVHNETNPMNTNKEWTTGAIALGCNNNLQGSCKFISLRTGEILDRRWWTEIPITQQVIEGVEQLAWDDQEDHLILSDRYNGEEIYQHGELAGVGPDITGVDEGEDVDDADDWFDNDDDAEDESVHFPDDPHNDNMDVGNDNADGQIDNAEDHDDQPQLQVQEEEPQDIY